MKLNIQRLLETCIEDGIKDALNTRKEGMNDEALLERISDHIWIGLDYYFDFEED
jgi:hypothetical protein